MDDATAIKRIFICLFGIELGNMTLAELNIANILVKNGQVKWQEDEYKERYLVETKS